VLAPGGTVGKLVAGALTAFGLEALNDIEVRTNVCLDIGFNHKPDTTTYNNNLFIKSIVTLKEKDDNSTSFIYGSKTYIFNHYNVTAGAAAQIRVYDPVALKFDDQFKPVRKINDDDKIKDFVTNQTILIYTNELKNKMETAIENELKINYQTLYDVRNTANVKYLGEDHTFDDTISDAYIGNIMNGVFDPTL
jgi:hypothetical protein